MNWITAARSIKTTLLGVIAGLLLILPQLRNALDGNPETLMSIEVILEGIALMGIGVAAKDGDKRSEDVGL